MSAIKEYYHEQICQGLEEQRKHLETLEKETTNQL
jgi:hypothetical protein